MFLVSLAALAASTAASVGPVTLGNAALPGVIMPAVGLGTGSYTNPPQPMPYPSSCWSCPNVTYDAVLHWLSIGGRRVDTALCYRTQAQIGRALRDSGVKRADVFLASKIGTCNGAAQGFNETLLQHAENLAQLGTDYTDLLLVHWPGPPDPALTTDPACQRPDIDGRWGACRRRTWAAMLSLLEKGIRNGSRAVGVSNFEQDHLMDLMPVAGANGMPSVNQMETQPWWHDDALLAVHRRLGIASNGYAPFAAPDFAHWNVSIATDPTLKEVGAATNRTSWQVALRWELQKGWMVNPRSKSPAHLAQNLAVAAEGYPALTAAQMAAIDRIHPQPREAPIHKVCPDPLHIP